MEYEHQELRVIPSEVDALERRLISDGWELYRQEGEQWPTDEAGKTLMQFRKPKK